MTQLVLMLPIIVGFAITAGATPIPILIMTEVSSTTLTYSWDGTTPQSGTATETAPDHWTFNLTDNVVDSLGGDQNINVYWQEPDYATSSLVNYVNFFVHGGNGSTVTVVSDTAQSQGYPLVDNGGTYNFYTGIPPVSGGNLAMFTDDGDSPANGNISGVPDGGRTAILLSISVAGLGLFRRNVGCSFA